MAESNPDKRLKLIEIVLTLGGFLGVITALQQGLLVASAKTTFSVLIVMFIIFAFFAYVSIAIPLDQKTIKFFVGALSASFSGLLAIELTIPLASQSSGVIVLTTPYVGVLGAVILFLVFVFAIAYFVYFYLTKAIRASFERMAPVQS